MDSRTGVIFAFAMLQDKTLSFATISILAFSDQLSGLSHLSCYDKPTAEFRKSRKILSHTDVILHIQMSHVWAWHPTGDLRATLSPFSELVSSA
jgi:hypothetical protein